MHPRMHPRMRPHPTSPFPIEHAHRPAWSSLPPSSPRPRAPTSFTSATNATGGPWGRGLHASRGWLGSQAGTHCMRRLTACPSLPAVPACRTVCFNPNQTAYYVRGSWLAGWLRRVAGRGRPPRVHTPAAPACTAHCPLPTRPPTRQTMNMGMDTYITAVAERAHWLAEEEMAAITVDHPALRWIQVPVAAAGLRCRPRGQAGRVHSTGAATRSVVLPSLRPLTGPHPATPCRPPTRMEAWPC